VAGVDGKGAVVVTGSGVVGPKARLYRTYRPAVRRAAERKRRSVVHKSATDVMPARRYSVGSEWRFEEGAGLLAIDVADDGIPFIGIKLPA